MLPIKLIAVMRSISTSTPIIDPQYHLVHLGIKDLEANKYLRGYLSHQFFLPGIYPPYGQ